MSDYTPTTGEVRDSLVYLNKNHAKQYGDVDLLVVESETAAQFDRWLAAIEQAAAEKALAEVRSTIGAYQEHGVWAFDQAVKSIERSRAAALGLTAEQEGETE